MTAAAYPAGPSAPPLVQTLKWLTRPLPFLSACRERHGDTFSLRFLGFQTPMVMISDPVAIRGLYTERANGLPPGRSLTLTPVLGEHSLLVQEGAEHLARRKLMLGPFHGERMRAYGPLMRAAAEREIQTWPLEREFAIAPRMQAVTLEVILEAVFGVEDEERRTRLRELFPALLAEASSARLQLRFLLHRRLGGKGPDPLRRLNALRSQVDALLGLQIAERRADPAAGERGDILSLLVAARFDDGSALDDAEIRDQLMTLLLAGHETTATALAWTIDLLLHHPEALARLRAEALAGEDEWLRAVIAESLRLRPVVPIAGRRLAADLEVDGRVLPAGTDVSPAIWLTHTRADVYPQPLAFRPERFLSQPPETYSWIPFGGGVRRCIGAAFAELEMREVLAAIVTRSELRPASPHPQRVGRRNITLAPRDGTPVIATARR